MRADVFLVERGLAASRTAAQRLIAGGHVFTSVSGVRTRLAKPSVELVDDAQIEIEANALERYVSRGGLKLEGAIKHVGITVNGLRCLDVGQSTGGFTDCLLQHGAAHVVGVDVGHAQLHPALARDARVLALEGINARELCAASFEHLPARNGHPAECEAALIPFDLVVCDVSFISLTKVLAQWPSLLKRDGRVLSLVKPQFEVGADNLVRGGIVRDHTLYAHVERDIRAACERARFEVLDYFESGLVGGDGNREFFIYAKHAGAK